MLKFYKVIYVLLAATTLFTVGFSQNPVNAGADLVNGQIVFDSTDEYDSEIYTMNSDGTFVTQLTDNTWSDFQPDWSSDGNKIVYVSTQSGDTEIYTMNSDGTSKTRITENSVGDIQPVWSPDGTKIAISRGAASLYVINSDGSGATLIAPEGRNPSWSPDGSRIAYSHFTNDGGDRDIFVVNADGTNIVRITNTPEFEDFPDWSPDGLEIAYTSHKDGNGNIYKINQDGNLPTRLTIDPGLDRKPSWSPDGTKIVFESYRDDHPEIYILNSDGTGSPVRLTNNELLDFNPDWGIFPDRVDFDEDGISDDIDTCPDDAQNDLDLDGICEGSGFMLPKTGDNDNCPDIFNPKQKDSDNDGIGDVCDDTKGDNPKNPKKPKKMK